MPAATEGIIRDVIVIDGGSDDGTLVVADAAGCTIIEGDAMDDPRRAAVEQARGDWLLFASPAVALRPEWQADALAFIDRALIGGQAQKRSATFRDGRLPADLFAWLRAVMRGGSTAPPGRQVGVAGGEVAVAYARFFSFVRFRCSSRRGMISTKLHGACR